MTELNADMLDLDAKYWMSDRNESTGRTGMLWIDLIRRSEFGSFRSNFCKPNRIAFIHIISIDCMEQQQPTNPEQPTSWKNVRTKTDPIQMIPETFTNPFYPLESAPKTLKDKTMLAKIIQNEKETLMDAICIPTIPLHP